MVISQHSDSVLAASWTAKCAAKPQWYSSMLGFVNDRSRAGYLGAL